MILTSYLTIVRLITAITLALTIGVGFAFAKSTTFFSDDGDFTSRFRERTHENFNQSFDDFKSMNLESSIDEETSSSIFSDDFDEDFGWLEARFENFDTEEDSNNKSSVEISRDRDFSITRTEDNRTSSNIDTDKGDLSIRNIDDETVKMESEGVEILFKSTN